MPQEAIIDFLDELFDGLRVDATEQAGGQHFEIEADVDRHMLLLISSDALANHDVAAIEASIADNAKALLEANPNTVVTMAGDLSCSV